VAICAWPGKSSEKNLTLAFLEMFKSIYIYAETSENYKLFVLCIISTSTHYTKLDTVQKFQTVTLFVAFDM
jgi:hypothetical protein